MQSFKRGLYTNVSMSDKVNLLALFSARSTVGNYKRENKKMCLNFIDETLLHKHEKSMKTDKLALVKLVIEFQ